MSTIPTADTPPSTSPPDSREQEARSLRACADVAIGLTPVGQARDCEEASLFSVAADLLRSTHLAESDRLQRAAKHHFATHACTPIRVPALIAQGRLISLPRLRDMLNRALSSNRSSI